MRSISQKSNINIAWIAPCNQFVPFQIIGAAHYTVGDKHITERSNRDDYQIILTVKGEGCVVYCEKEYTLTPNSFLLINCNKPHKYFVEKGKKWEYKHIHFKPNIYNNLLHNIPLYQENCSDAFLFFDRFSEYIYSKHGNSNISHFLYSNFIENILVAALLSKYNSSIISSIIPNSDISFSNVIEYIRNNFNKQISLSDLTKEFNYSESYFIRLFKKFYNCTPHQYIIKYRLSKTYELIAKGVTVESAALHCGFNSASSFYYTAKKHRQS